MVKNIKKLIIPVFLSALILNPAAAYCPAAAQGSTAGQEGAPLRAGFDIAAATAFAKKHWNDGVGFCAEFCSNVLKAGGFTITGAGNRTKAYTQYYHLVHELGFESYFLGNGKVTQNADKIEEGDLVLWDKSFRLKGNTNNTVNISGPGGHIVYISQANGPSSKYCAHNPRKLDAVLNTGDSQGLWLIKTSALAGNEKLAVRDVEPAQYEVRVTGNIHMSPNGELCYDGGNPRVTSRGDIITIDKTCIAGGYIWGRIENSVWDWVVFGYDRMRAPDADPPFVEAENDWAGEVTVITAGNVRSSPYGYFQYRILVEGNIRAAPYGDLRGDAVTKNVSIVSITDTRYEGGWLWGRLDNGGWDWIALERRDGSDKRYEFVVTQEGDTLTIAEQQIAGGWLWGRIAGTGGWIAVEYLATGEARCEKIEQ